MFAGTDNNYLRTVRNAIYVGAIPPLMLPIIALASTFKCCQPAKARKPSRAALLYRQYFGVDGIYYEYKTLASQFVTVGLQATFKVKVLGAAAHMSGMVWTYWAFFCILLLNAIVPSLLLSSENERVRREFMAIYDIGSDVLYIILFTWGTCNALAFNMAYTPTGIGNYTSNIFPMLHVLATAGALERAVATRLKAAQKDDAPEADRSTHIHDSRFRASKAIVAAALLGLTLGISSSDHVYGVMHPKPASCGACECENDVNVGQTSPLRFNAGAGTLVECERALATKHALLRLKSYMWALYNLGVTDIEPGAFRHFRGISLNSIQVIIANQDISRIRRQAFDGFDGIERLTLYQNKIASLDNNAFEGCDRLGELTIYGNNLASMTNGTFSGLRKLEALFLQDNAIISFERGTFDHLPRLSKIYIWGNLITCAILTNQTWVPPGACDDTTAPRLGERDRERRERRKT